ncbi:MAG: NADPH-dependent F420 reductase [Planctomycetes bacterium]|nr:NADPH-dependent F420 reductase [Alphaproteobacteria bacterium]MBM3978644.1 NADPH-dependent F420 reductase [Planctomycetota bacterium]
MPNAPKRTIAVLGGTGKEGSGLALRWAHAGHSILIGSRSTERAREAAAGINARAGAQRATGADNRSAAQGAEIVVLAVPYSAQLTMLSEVKAVLDGKILIDVTVPLVPPKVSTAQLPDGGSAVLKAQAMLGSGVRVVSAFQNVSAEHLTLGQVIDCDVLVCGDDRDAREAAVALARDAGMRAFHAGPLANSVVAEALTSVLIAINRQYKIKHSGIRITGLPDDAGRG